MPYNGSGVFNLVYNWENDASNGILIRADRMDGQESDMATNGFGNCLTRDGQGIATANLPMGGFVHTGVGNATAANEYAVVGQVQNNSYLFSAAGGTVNAITAAFTPATTLTNGAQHCVRAAGANTIVAVTYSPDGNTAAPVTKFGGQILAIGDIRAAGHNLELEYNSAANVWELLNPALSNEPPGYITGLTLSTPGSSSQFSVAAGSATGSGGLGTLILRASITKTTGAWVAGTGNGSLDTGSIANATWYHVYLIISSVGVVDIITSLSASVPAFPTGYATARRIGALLTDGSANWVAFSQLGNEFLWNVMPLDVSVINLGTAQTNYTLSVPLGIKVQALVQAQCSGGSGTQSMTIASPDQTLPSSIGNIVFAGSTSGGGFVQTRTNTSSQIAAISTTASTILNLRTRGWIDPRGQF